MAHLDWIPLALTPFEHLELKEEELGWFNLGPDGTNLVDGLFDVQPQLDHQVRRDEGCRPRHSRLTVYEYALAVLSSCIDEVRSRYEMFCDVCRRRVIDCDPVHIYTTWCIVLLTHWRDTSALAGVLAKVETRLKEKKRG